MNTDLILFFDTETTGIPDWKIPSGGDDQPHIVQLAAVLASPIDRKIVQSIDVIIRPDDWVSTKEAFETHGFTEEYAKKVGVPEHIALGMFLSLWGYRPRVAFNTTFDNRIIRIGTKRFSPVEVQDAWKAGSQGVEWVCAMLQSKKIIGGKQPKLKEAYKFFFGKEPEAQHTAMSDTLACMEIYWKILDHKS